VQGDHLRPLLYSSQLSNLVLCHPWLKQVGPGLWPSLTCVIWPMG